MKDVFELMGETKQRHPLIDKMIAALRNNHWSVKVILKNQKDQRILHEYLVEGKHILDIAEQLNVSYDVVINTRNRAMLWLERYLLQNTNMTDEWKARAPVLDFDFDVLEVVQKPDQADVNEIKQLLSTRIEEYTLTARAFNALKSNKINYLRDIVTLPSPQWLLRYPNFGRKSMTEVQWLIYGLGLKWREPMPTGSDLVPPIARTIHLSVDYRLDNFTWNNEIKQAFKQLNIDTILTLYLSRTLLTQYKKLTPEHLAIIQQRIKDWGLSWE